MARRSKKGTLKEERTYKQYRITAKYNGANGEFSSAINILQKIAIANAPNHYALKYSYDWFAKVYSSSDLIVAYAEVCSGEIIRKYTQKINPLFPHPKARMLIEHKPTEGPIAHTVLKRINQFQQLCTVNQQNKKIIQQYCGNGIVQEFSVTENGKFISSTGPAKTVKGLAGIAVLLWFLYEKDPRGPNFGFHTIQAQDTEINFFKVDNTKSLWTLDPKLYARFTKLDRDQEHLSKSIKTNNWFIDKLIDYMPDHLHFFNMDPHIFYSPEFKNEMHEMILHILLNPINEIVDIFKSHYPDNLNEEKCDDDCDESSLDGSSSSEDDKFTDKNESNQGVNIVEFNKQIVRILLCLIARKTQFFEWASKEPEFITFLNSKGLPVNNLQVCIEKDNQVITQDFYNTNKLTGNRVVSSENAIKYEDIVDLCDLPGFPAILKSHIVHFQSMPNIVEKWRNINDLNEHTSTAKSNLVTSPSRRSPIKSTTTSPRKYAYVAVVVDDNAQKLSSLPGTLFAMPDSPKGMPVALSSPRKDSIVPGSPSCKRHIKFDNEDDREIKYARVQSSLV